MPELSPHACHDFRSIRCNPILRGSLLLNFWGVLCLCQIFLLHTERADAASTNIPVVAVEQSDGELYKIFERFNSKGSSQTTPYQTALAAARDAHSNEASDSVSDGITLRLNTENTRRTHSLSFLQSPEHTSTGPIGSTKRYNGSNPSLNTQKQATAQRSNSRTQPITPKGVAVTPSSVQTPRKLNPSNRSDSSMANPLTTARFNPSDRDAASIRSANYSEEPEAELDASDQSDVDMRSLVHQKSVQFEVDAADSTDEEYFDEERISRSQTAANPPQAPNLSRRHPPQPPQPFLEQSSLADLDAALNSNFAIASDAAIPTQRSSAQANPMFAANRDSNHSLDISETPAESSTEESDSVLDKAFPGMKEKSGSKLAFFSADSNFSSVLSVMGCLCVVLGIFFVFALFMKKVGPKSGKHIPREALENVGQFALNPKMQLNLLRLGNRLILVATTQDGVVETLTEIDHPDEVAQILGVCRKIDPSSSQSQFQSVLNEFTQEKTSPGFFGSNGTKSRTPAEPSLSSLLSSGLDGRGSQPSQHKQQRSDRKNGVVYG